MANDIQLQIDAADVEKRIKKLRNIKNGGPKAVMRAMNRTVTGMKTDAKKGITSRYTVKQKDVKDKLEVEKASMSDLSIAMTSRGRPLRSFYFKHKKNKTPGIKGGSPVFLNVKKSNSGGLINSKGKRSKAFMATMANGMEGIFVRTGAFVNRTLAKEGGFKVKSRKGKFASNFAGRTTSNKGREAIRQVYSPGVVQMLNNEDTRKEIQTKAEERFNKELDHQVKYLLDQQKG